MIDDALAHEIAELRGLVEMLRAERAEDRAELHALRARVTRWEAGRARRDARRDARLLAAIGAAIGDHVFTGAELIAHAQTTSPPLQRVLERAGLHSPQQLGKWLQRVQGRDLAGLRVERVGANNGGAL